MQYETEEKVSGIIREYVTIFTGVTITVNEVACDFCPDERVSRTYFEAV
jgi:hypothetical protein